MASDSNAAVLRRTITLLNREKSAQTPEAGPGLLISGAAAKEGKALTALAGLSAYSSWSGGRIAALKTRSLILVSYRKFQNDFREISRGKTGYIDDVVTHSRTQFSDKRPLIGMKGLTKGARSQNPGVGRVRVQRTPGSGEPPAFLFPGRSARQSEMRQVCRHALKRLSSKAFSLAIRTICPHRTPELLNS